MRCCERHSFDRLQADWEESKAQYLGSLQRLGEGSAVLASCSDGKAQVALPPLQDASIIEALVSEPMSLQLVQKIATLSANSCPAYQNELTECWNIVGHELKMTSQSITAGAVKYLQGRYFDEVKGFVYKHATRWRVERNSLTFIIEFQ